MLGRRSRSIPAPDLRAATTIGAAPASAAGQTAEDSTPAGGMFSSLRDYRSVRWLSAAILSTNTAHGMHHVTLGWLALQLTDSPLWVGLAGFAGGIPILLLALPAGMVVDRKTRRSVMLAGQLGLLMTSLLFAVTVSSDIISRWLMLVLALGSGSSMAFIFPAKHAMLANLVKKRDLANAVANISAGQNMARVLGPALAGVLIATIGLGATFGVAALLQLIGFTTTLRVASVPNTNADKPKPGLRRVIDGLAHVRRVPALRGTMLLASLATILLMPYLTLMPVFARDELELGSQGLGIMMAVTGIGAVAGALAVAGLKTIMVGRGVQIFAIVAWALSIIAFAQTPWIIPAMVLLFATGVMSAVFLAINQTVLQMRVDEEMRGRVMSVILLTWGMMPFGVLPLGALADRVGAPLAVTISSSLALVLAVVIVLRIPELREPAA